MKSLFDIKNDVNYLTKEELTSLLKLNIDETKKMKKDELIKLFFKVHGKSKKTATMIYKDYPVRFGLYPGVVEETLNITKTERKELEEEGFLPVISTGSFRQYGKNIEFSIYDRLSVVKLTEKKIEKWRENREKEITKRRKEGSKKAASKIRNTHLKNKNITEDFYNGDWEDMLEKWYEFDKILGATLQLSFWTVWLSRWAKEYQVKAETARSKKEDYLAKKNEYYNMKNKALKLLSESPYTKIQFYQPENSDKIMNLSLCETHYQDWCNQREWVYLSIWEYYGTNKKVIKKCPCCSLDKIKDYYSLYFMEIKDSRIPDFKFSFHTPYPIGKVFLPDKEKLPRINHESEGEGLFRFGRSLQNDEIIIFKEKLVKEFYEEAKENFLNTVKSKTLV